MRTPNELTGLFRERGLKVTPQRQAVFRALVDHDGHPTAESVHAVVTAEMPSVSLRTVYQVLNDLTAMGEINALELGTGAARFDPNVDAHHHLVCTACGKVRDVYVDPVAPPATAPGFTVDSAEVVFRGRCDDCAPVAPARRPQTPDTRQPRRATCPT
jgi:Fur family peroxide stress response transcriptional regulator